MLKTRMLAGLFVLFFLWTQVGFCEEEPSKLYHSIPLAGPYDFQKIGLGDLDGDGELEFIIKQPNFNVDPYQKPGYWKPSPSPYRLEAYKKDGSLLWVYDMGWSIETGIWYSPWVVYDLDGDGRAEIYCKAGEGDPRNLKGLVESGPEYLVKIDGLTGKVVAKTDWISRAGYPDYNFYSRNMLAIAYLDGKKPSLIMQRGTYNIIKTWALDADFRILWKHEVLQKHPEKSRNYYGQGSHGLIAADVDQDGRDELVIGAAVIDDNGKGLWSLGMGHPDIVYCADIDPDHPGLEICYGFETRQDTDGICVVDAKTGKKLWGHPEKTFHLHGQGMCADFLEEYPGMEVYCGERDYKKRWMYTARGDLVQFLTKTELSPRPVWWDDDLQKEVVTGRKIGDWGKEPMTRIEGNVVLVVDCMGDWREEVITSVKGEIRIYSSPIPSSRNYPPLLSNRQSRLGIVNQTSGYYYPAHVGLDYPWD